MGNLTTPETLALRWDEVLRDPALRNLPYKIELNAWGKIEMSPASNRHGRLQSLISAELLRQLPEGIVVSEASVLTDIGVRVPDVAWGSASFARTHGESTPFPRAPELCERSFRRRTRTRRFARRSAPTWLPAPRRFGLLPSTARSGTSTKAASAPRAAIP